MNRNGELHFNPASLRLSEERAHAETFDVVVPYTGPEMTAKVVDRAAEFATGLNATLTLVAVYVAPYPCDLSCPTAMREHLTARLTELAELYDPPARVHLVVARSRDEGFRQVIQPGSTVLLGTRKHWWRTREERLARELAREGHRVSLLHFD